TDDDPFRTGTTTLNRRQANLDGGEFGPDEIVDEDAAPEKMPWCYADFASSLNDLYRQNPDLQNQVNVQVLPVGLPLELTGGEKQQSPPRAMMAVCDADYRWLSLAIGLPDAHQLASHLEDAQELSMWERQLAKNPIDLIDAVHNRSAKRLDRSWRDVMGSTVKEIKEEVDLAIVGGSLVSNRNQLLSLCESLESYYVSDVKLRFGLSEASDARRLRILEHHVQTRRPWCQAILPAIALADFRLLHSCIVDLLWGFPPVYGDRLRLNESSKKEAIQWAALHLQSSPIVLSVEPVASKRFDAWPPLANTQRERRGNGWKDVHNKAAQGKYRSVNLSTLASILRNQGSTPIDVRFRAVRYVALSNRNEKALAFHETDPPGKFAVLLRKHRSILAVR
ncbi:MAG: hypothetical protein AAF664_26610, partial [Planctomycetota bacterium]